MFPLIPSALEALDVDVKPVILSTKSEPYVSSPTSTRPSQQPSALRAGSRPFTSVSRPPPTINDTRYPNPPPPDDLLGPAARWPYLPAKSEYDGPEIRYSSRPGGPRIYDLLGTLPMEPFGVLGWAVLDREEEIFECDDIKDEYKVIHALWARWIILNRWVVSCSFSAFLFLTPVIYCQE